MKTKFVVLLLMLIVLSACGYRGDLRLPPEGSNLVP
ncbi:MAG: LPS translocon maturation chaperone LptM, partial [Candidatus Oxydemutatoraceae bacterium WSBS_2016_MAG_OTU14]